LRGFNGVIGFDFGISLFGTISFTACTVGLNNLGGFTFFGWSRFRWASVLGDQRVFPDANQHIPVEQEADATEHLLFFDVLLAYQGRTDASGETFAEGHR